MRTEPHPIELALLALLLVADALAVLVAALMALVLSLASWRPTPTPSHSLLNVAYLPHLKPTRPAPAPLLHPLTLLAGQLEALPHRELMQLAGTRRRLAKHRLAELVVVG